MASVASAALVPAQEYGDDDGVDTFPARREGECELTISSISKAQRNKFTEIFDRGQKWPPPAVDPKSSLAQSLLPLPTDDQLVLLTNVCMYNEPGYALDRTVQSLALQQLDWANGADAKPDSKIYAWVLIDGWRRPSGRAKAAIDMNKVLAAATMKQTLGPGQTLTPDLESAYNDAINVHLKDTPKLMDPILNPSAIETLAKLFECPTLDEELEHLFAEPDADYALLQFGREIQGHLQLAPVTVDCTDANQSQARRSTINNQPVIWPHSSKSSLYLSVLIKRQNAKKHDSHRLFFEVLGRTFLSRHTTLQYYFCTDVGTLYAPDMIKKLAGHMDIHPESAACCAHQRIMSYVDQAEPGVQRAEAPFAAFMRNIQQFDFESGLAVFNGLHASLQFLPVLPGPCAFFRATSMSEDLLRTQRNIITSPEHEDGIINGNLKIAEDRIPSYLVLLDEKSSSNETHWVPEATFYFESEDSLNEFVPQRRRWLNGTVAGYLWLLTSRPVIVAACNMKLMAWKILGLCVLQLMIFATVFTMPALFVITGHLAIFGLFSILNAYGMNLSLDVPRGIALVFWITYISSFMLLTGYARWGSKPVVQWLWRFRIILNAFIMLLNACVLIAIVVLSLSPDNPMRDQLSDQGLQDIKIAAAGAVLYTTTPFFLTLMHSWASFSALMQSFPSFFLFLPTILCDLFAYSVAKLDDWSWGTKSSGASADAADVSAARTTRTARQRLSAKTTAVFLTQNIALLVLSISYLVLKDIYVHFLIWEGFIPAMVSMSIMAGSFWFYFSRSCGTIGRYLTCSRRPHDSFWDAIVRCIVFVLWAATFGLWGWFVLHVYAHVDISIITPYNLDDPLVSIAGLLGLVAIFATFRFMFERDAKGRGSVALEPLRQTWGQRAIAGVIAAFCVVGSVTCLTVLLLTILNQLCCCRRVRGERVDASLPSNASAHNVLLQPKARYVELRGPQDDRGASLLIN